MFCFVQNENCCNNTELVESESLPLEQTASREAEDYVLAGGVTTPLNNTLYMFHRPQTPLIKWQFIDSCSH